jgi:chemotaxis protein histidine kinase CheA
MQNKQEREWHEREMQEAKKKLERAETAEHASREKLEEALQTLSLKETECAASTKTLMSVVQHNETFEAQAKEAREEAKVSGEALRVLQKKHSFVVTSADTVREQLQAYKLKERELKEGLERLQREFAEHEAMQEKAQTESQTERVEYEREHAEKEAAMDAMRIMVESELDAKRRKFESEMEESRKIAESEMEESRKIAESEVKEKRKKAESEVEEKRQKVCFCFGITSFLVFLVFFFVCVVDFFLDYLFFLLLFLFINVFFHVYLEVCILLIDFFFFFFFFFFDLKAHYEMVEKRKVAESEVEEKQQKMQVCSHWVAHYWSHVENVLIG